MESMLDLRGTDHCALKDGARMAMQGFVAL
jgi:hypothetical protein